MSFGHIVKSRAKGSYDSYGLGHQSVQCEVKQASGRTRRMEIDRNREYAKRGKEKAGIARKGRNQQGSKVREVRAKIAST